jgi:CO/xanthine dehydrogenase FAD-binding subunit
MSFVIAASIDDALTALASGARPIAGGSDLVVGARHGKAPLPASLVAIDRIDALRTVERRADGGLRIGAGVSHSVLEHHAEVIATHTALADAAALVGSPATRHVGTLGGNVMNGSPAMDTGAPLVVFGATATLASTSGRRVVSMGDLWIGPGRTSARPDELCVAIDLPAAVAHSASAYVRLEYRRAMEIAVVGAAAFVTLDGDGTITDVRVALTAVAPTIVEVTGLTGGPPADVAAAAAAAASDQARPISDLRASDRYRRHTVGVMARRAVDAATRRARGEIVGVPVNRSLGIGATS